MPVSFSEVAEKCANRGCSNPLGTTGRPKSCKACKSRYQREWQVLRAEETEAIGWRRGAEAMKAVLLTAMLNAHPTGGLVAPEAVSVPKDANLRGVPRAASLV